MVFYWTWFWFVGLIPKYEVGEVDMAYSPSDYLTRLHHIHNLSMPANNHNPSPDVLCMLPTVRMIPSGLIRYTLMPYLLIPQKIPVVVPSYMSSSNCGQLSNYVCSPLLSNIQQWRPSSFWFRWTQKNSTFVLSYRNLFLAQT